MADGGDMEKGAVRKYPVPALEKGLDILEYLAEQGTSVTQADLSRALDRQPSEMFRILTCLQTRGYLRRNAESGGYALTLRMFELSRIHSPHEVILSVARPLMRMLADETRESCHLSVLHNGEVLVLAQEESPRAFRLSIEVGSRHPPLETTSGRLLLAAHPPEERLDILRETPKWRAMDKAARSQALDRLQEIARTGHEIEIGGRYACGADIGVMIGSQDRSLHAALTIAKLIEMHDPVPVENALPALKRCAAQIAMRAGLEDF